MGLATVDPHSQKEHTKIYKMKSPSLVLIRLVLTEIQAFKNKKKLQRNVWKCGQMRTLSGFVRISVHFFVIVFVFKCLYLSHN